jgi:hypothetical protein
MHQHDAYVSRACECALGIRLTRHVVVQTADADVLERRWKTDRAIRDHLDTGVLQVRYHGGRAGPVIVIPQDGKSPERCVHRAEEAREASSRLRMDADKVPAEEQKIGAKVIQPRHRRLNQRPSGCGPCVKVRCKRDSQAWANR